MVKPSPSPKAGPPPVVPVVLVTSRVRELCDRRSWGLKEFTGECMRRGICSVDTARDLYNGVTNVRVVTMAAIARYVFEVKLSKVIELAEE
jgi:hypothetical protein